ncbi:unnamed protein product [Larinioides sclopetarius]|uniref:Uncharacterized protein n=1 Tax=Larinioides sclopetarius TaxID=280406 RepID=A0AAV1Z4A7_9ARAC
MRSEGSSLNTKVIEQQPAANPKPSPIQELPPANEELREDSSCFCEGVLKAICCCFCLCSTPERRNSDVQNNTRMGSSRENKLVVLGPGGVGKTSLVVQYLEGFFTTTYKPTVEDYYRHTIKMPDGAFHTVQILDTAGSLNFPAMRELSIRSGRGFILVFSVDNLQSFHEALQLWDLIQRIRGETTRSFNKIAFLKGFP